VLGPDKEKFWGQNNYFDGTKRVFGPYKQNLRGQNSNFGRTNYLKIDETKQGFWGDQTMIWGHQTMILGRPNNDYGD